MTNRCRNFIDRHIGFVVVGTFLYLTALGIGVVVVGVKAYQTAEANRKAGCQLRTDQQQRYTENVKFLNAHPNGATIGDITVSRGDLLRMIEGLRRNVAALGGLQCETPVRLVPPAPAPPGSIP